MRFTVSFRSYLSPIRKDGACMGAPLQIHSAFVQGLPYFLDVRSMFGNLSSSCENHCFKSMFSLTSARFTFKVEMSPAKPPFSTVFR
jgi:hypothetical protein